MPFALLVGLSFAASTGASAQQPPAAPLPVDTAALVQVRLQDGSQLLGRVVARDDSSLTIQTAGGLRAVVPLAAIAEWSTAEGRMVRGRFWRRDPNATRLFFTATGRTLNGGEGYFADYFLFFPFVAVGFGDRFMAAGGVSLIPGIESQLLYFAPKVGIVRSPTTNLALGTIVASIPDEGTVGAVYGAATLGPEDAAVTVLLGYPWGEGIQTHAPGFVIGGEARTSRSTKLLAELWKVPDTDEVPLVAGLRIFGERLAVDFGLVSVLGADFGGGLPFIPWVDFVVNFGGPPSARAPQPALLNRAGLWGQSNHRRP